MIHNSRSTNKYGPLQHIKMVYWIKCMTLALRVLKNGNADWNHMSLDVSVDQEKKEINFLYKENLKVTRTVFPAT